jgi:hypothetical protein
MATDDKCVTIVPYFKLHAGKIEDFKKVCQQFVELSRNEPKCLFYGWSFDGDNVHCREGYEDASGLLEHLDHVGSLLPELFKLGDVTRLEIHGPKEELEKLRGPLADFKPQYFTLEYGFRRH